MSKQVNIDSKMNLDPNDMKKFDNVGYSSKNSSKIIEESKTGDPVNKYLSKKQRSLNSDIGLNMIKCIKCGTATLVLAENGNYCNK